jgi:hypothetical protein
LADVAARHCLHHADLDRQVIGRVACGECWERAIRDDERVVVEYGLPREITTDPTYVDEIAVEQACRGERVPLTEADRVEAVRRLRRSGLGLKKIAARLHLPAALVTAIVYPSSSPHAATQRRVA